MSFNSKNNNNQDPVKHSKPIPINTTHARRRSGSVSSSDSSGSPSSPPPPQTPNSSSSSPCMLPPNLSPTSSPILSYFMGQSPTKISSAAPPTTAATFPFNRKFGGAPPVFEEEEHVDEVPVAVHARRASTAGKFGPQATLPAIPDPQRDRGTGLLRRLSLGGAFARPATTERNPSPPRPRTPPNTAVPNTAVDSGNGQCKIPNVGANAQGARVRRSATLNVDGGGRTRRAPSPMGERILKGHFDGFN